MPIPVDHGADGSPSGGDGALELTEAEVAQLWWFSDGAIMNPQTRRQLWRNWGLCDRHTWAYFVIECELRWQPLGTAVLYQDLLDRAIAAWPARWAPAAVRRRTFGRRFGAGSVSCPTCEYAAHTRRAPGFAAQHRRANRSERSRAFVTDCRSTWQRWMCPWCVPTGSGVPCRVHLAAGHPPPDHTDHGALLALQDPLRRCVRSMTHGGQPRPETNAALVGVLGWFAGWQGALTLAPDAWSTTDSPHRDSALRREP